MERDRWRLTVKLKSRQALTQYMDYKQLPTAYALARAAKLKTGVVGHIVAGRRTSCSLTTAKAIEEALGCPPNFLFEPTMSEVARDSRLKQSA